MFACLLQVALGYPDTTRVTMADMLHHCRAVARGASTPFLVGDMPFGSYQVSPDAALVNAIRFIQEANMQVHYFIYLYC
jgi:3-methyl-2-oxobutanoate hydroxymethyltransferase